MNNEMKTVQTESEDIFKILFKPVIYFAGFIAAVVIGFNVLLARQNASNAEHATEIKSWVKSETVNEQARVSEEWETFNISRTSGDMVKRNASGDELLIACSEDKCTAGFLIRHHACETNEIIQYKIEGSSDSGFFICGGHNPIDRYTSAYAYSEEIPNSKIIKRIWQGGIMKIYMIRKNGQVSSVEFNVNGSLKARSKAVDASYRTDEELRREEAEKRNAELRKTQFFVDAVSGSANEVDIGPWKAVHLGDGSGYMYINGVLGDRFIYECHDMQCTAYVASRKQCEIGEEFPVLLEPAPIEESIDFIKGVYTPNEMIVCEGRFNGDLFLYSFKNANRVYDDFVNDRQITFRANKLYASFEFINRSLAIQYILTGLK